MKKHQKADPMRTKSGKARLRPLNMRQLDELLKLTASNKEKHKIRKRMIQLQKQPGYKAPSTEMVTPLDTPE